MADTIKLTISETQEATNYWTEYFTQVSNIISHEIIITLIILIIFTLIIIVSKLYVKLTCGMCNCAERLDGKVVLITGATSGIGKEAASDLYQRGATVILAVRSIQRGLNAVNQIKERSINNVTSTRKASSTVNMRTLIFDNQMNCKQNEKQMCHHVRQSMDKLQEENIVPITNDSIRSTGQLIVKHCDLASFTSVRAFVSDLLKCFKSIDIIILNAGMVPPPGKHLSVDSNEMQFQCNHLSHFLMINLLLPRLISNSQANLTKSINPTTVNVSQSPIVKCRETCNSPEVRIIVVSSMLHSYGTIDFDNLNFEKNILDPFWQYSMSKLANILMVKELSRRLREYNLPITVNALHPGLVKTSINRHTPWYLKHLLQPIMYKLWAKSAQQGAQTTIYLAVSPKVANITGEYFSDCKQVTSSDASNDTQLASKLWSVSENICNLTKKSSNDDKFSSIQMSHATSAFVQL